MKKIITAFIVLLVLINTALATDISVGIKSVEYSQYTSILQGQTEWAEESLDEYIEEALGCSRVRFELTILDEPGIFSKGLYDLTLTAKCTATFKDFKFKFYHGYDEDYTTLDISYIQDGVLKKKGFKTRAWY